MRSRFQISLSRYSNPYRPSLSLSVTAHSCISSNTLPPFKLYASLNLTMGSSNALVVGDIIKTKCSLPNSFFTRLPGSPLLLWRTIGLNWCLGSLLASSLFFPALYHIQLVYQFQWIAQDHLST